jgi:hypothetical protein
LAETNIVLARTEDEKRSSQQEAEQLRAALAAQIEQLHTTQAELAQVGNELGQYRIQHMMLVQVLEGIRNSRIWRWSAWLRIWPKPRLTQNELIPVSKMRRLDSNRWACDGQAQMALPCLPITGKIRIELRLQVSVGGHAHLYFDTGHLFNSGEHLDLGPVEGEITIERETNLLAPVHCFRLDPLDRSGEFTISHFQISRI